MSLSLLFDVNYYCYLMLFIIYHLSDISNLMDMMMGDAPHADNDSIPLRLDQTNGSCMCPAVHKPVCSTDGKVYDNSCLANCRSVKIMHCHHYIYCDSKTITTRTITAPDNFTGQLPLDNYTP